MAFLSTYASHKILDFILGNVAYTVPTNFSIALSKTALGTEGTNLTEPTGGSYARLQIPNDKITFSVAANKIVTIIKDFSFPESTADWGTVTHFVMFDNSANVWFYGELQNSFDVQIESSIVIDAGTNDFIFDIYGGSTIDMNITTTFANQILNHFFGRNPLLTPPANYYLGVSSTAIGVLGTGITEPIGGGYARLQLPNNKTTFTAATNKKVAVAKEFRFNMANVSWGNMTHYFISDALTGGNILWTGKLVNNRNVQINTTLVVKPNGFTWSLDNPPTP